MKACFNIFILLVVFVATIQAQNKSFVKSLDSNSSVQSNKYLIDNDFTWLNDELEPFSIDQEALNAAVFKGVNEARKKLKKEECVYDYKLDVIAYQHVLNLKYYKFRNTVVNQSKMNRYMYWASRRIGVNEGFVMAIVDVPYLMDYKKGNSFYYNQKDEETDMHLFYGSKSQLRDSSYVPEAIPLYDYASFGKAVSRELMKGRSGRKIRSASYTKMACWIMPIEKTMAGKRIPQGKMIIVFSGMRMGEIAGVYP